MDGQAITFSVHGRVITDQLGDPGWIVSPGILRVHKFTESKKKTHMKTIHIVVGIAAVAGVAWYIRNKRLAAGQTTATSETVTQVVTTKIPMPSSEVEATKIVKLPGSLLPNTSGNTGIVPP